MEVTLTLVGTTPILTHNDRLSDPDDEFAEAIAKINRKRKKTKADRKEIEKLEWFGGLYIEDGALVMPTRCIRKCLIEAARITRQGKQIERGVNFMSMSVPLDYEGSRDMKVLQTDKTFRDRRMVKIGQAKIPRVRARFLPWSVTAKVLLLDKVLSLEHFAEIADMAGMAVGLLDNRCNGFGRFDVTLS